MTDPSPFRKLVPPLVWPVGILLIAGYCFVGNRSAGSPCIPRDRCAPIRAAERSVSIESAPSERVGVDMERTSAVAFAEAEMIDVRIPLLVILGGVLAILVVVRRRRSADARGERAGSGGA